MRLEVVSQIAAADLPEVQALIDLAEHHDGVRAIGEHKFLRVTQGSGDEAAAILVRDSAQRLIGYGNVERFPIEGDERLAAEIVVHPEHRRRGVGSQLLREVLTIAEAHSVDRVDMWAYRQLPGTTELAAKFGFSPIRELLEIRMPLPESLPDAPLPEGIELRAFRPAVDGAEWLALNNLVFAGHPEQGNWTDVDIAARLTQTWFKPEDFLLATDSGRLVAFNWLKLDEEKGEGEIYVIGVHPGYRRMHFGRSLTILGLRHMKNRGMTEATAYVDGGNTGAVAMYYGLGFSLDHTDLCYSRPMKDASAG